MLEQVQREEFSAHRVALRLMDVAIVPVDFGYHLAIPRYLKGQPANILRRMFLPDPAQLGERYGSKWRQLLGGHVRRPMLYGKPVF
ncbi:hypothetical protein ACM7UQ_29425 [Pseudomonas aeruginosa]